jgi:hypothetical protein
MLGPLCGSRVGRIVRFPPPMRARRHYPTCQARSDNVAQVLRLVPPPANVSLGVWQRESRPDAAGTSHCDHPDEIAKTDKVVRIAAVEVQAVGMRAVGGARAPDRVNQRRAVSGSWVSLAASVWVS